jgi:hypothetical protein
LSPAAGRRKRAASQGDDRVAYEVKADDLGTFLRILKVARDGVADAGAKFLDGVRHAILAGRRRERSRFVPTSSFSACLAD